MSRLLRLLLVVAVLAGATAAAGSARTTRAKTGGPLTGTWRGVLSGTVNGRTYQQGITIVVNAAENAGTWKVSASCHGNLTLDGVDAYYHHYLRHLAAGSTCHGGDIDCLWPHGSTVFDNVTPRPGSNFGRSGTLRKVS